MRQHFPVSRLRHPMGAPVVLESLKLVTWPAPTDIPCPRFVFRDQNGKEWPLEAKSTRALAARLKDDWSAAVVHVDTLPLERRPRGKCDVVGVGETEFIFSSAALRVFLAQALGPVPDPH